ncbi:MAG: dTMP kinase [Fusobacteriaceae bacterium]
MAKIIVIEGTDGSGKETQTKLLLERLPSGVPSVVLQSFPNYEGRGCEPTKMYLNGELGDLKDISPYAASVMFATDRYVTIKSELSDKFKENSLFIFDRYVTSNMLYQASKFEERIEAMKMVAWISDLEYNKMKLPRPTITLFLDMPPWASKKLREGRLNKITGDDKQDIHESNEEYLEKVYAISKDIAYSESWIIIECVNSDNSIKTIEEINVEIIKQIKKNLSFESN